MLKGLMIAKKIDQRKAELAQLKEQETALQTREAELEVAIDEAKTDEELAVVEENITKNDNEKKELDEKKSRLEGEIAQLEGELEQLNSKDPTKNNPPALGSERNETNKGGEVRMKRGFFQGMNRAEVDTLIAREDVKEFLTRTREFAQQKRAVTGADLLIPDVLLGLLRDNIALSSKLITKVNFKPLKGTARQNITGTIPEAVWTEMVGALNELEISFNQVEVDGYKVGGFVVIPNSTLQDSDINLASEILAQISKAIGIALDKAILYGTGIKQPLGIVTRLAQTSEPSGYPANAPAWEDLHTSNIKKLNSTGAALIGDIIGGFAACKNDYSNGQKFHAMNSVTYAYLMGTLLNFNAAGALVTGMNNQMPVLGGDIVILDFMANYDIVSGYGDLYLLVEREGTVLASSEHVKFIEDQTVFKGLARYDGLPVIAKGFVLMNIKNANATTSATFETDWANTEIGALGVTSAASATTSGDTVITVSGTESTGTTLAYKVAGKAVDVKNGQKPVGFTDWDGDDEITAATGKIITVVELNGDGRAIKVGSCSVVAKA
jgi:HK97 family phage major capsid protein